MIELFAATAPTDIANLRRALEQADPAGLSMAAHALKGSCSNFGAASLYGLCIQIEKLALNANLHGAADVITRAGKELDRLLDALHAYRQASLP
ncbi:MAG: Hpt domain-containing protein [Acidobacteriota bacterium]